MFRKTAPEQAAPRKAPANGAIVTDAAPCQKRLTITVTAEEIAPLREVVLKEFQREVVLPGFRKGKAPSGMVEQKHGPSIQEETIQRATQQAFQKVVKEQGLKPVGPFELSKADYQAQRGLTLEATVEVEPEFTLAAYTGLAVTRPSAEVSDAEVAESMMKLQESMAQMVPGAAGEPKQKTIPPLDDSLAKDLGFETLEKLREHVRSKIVEQKVSAQQQALEAGVYEALLTRHTFEVPPKLVEHQAGKLTGDFKMRLTLSGVPEEKVEEEAGKFTDQLRGNAERLVKLSFILDRIAEAEKIGITQDELVKRLWDLSRRWQKDPVEVRQILDKQGLWPSIASAIRQEKTVARLLSTAAITDTVVPPPVVGPAGQHVASGVTTGGGTVQPGGSKA